MSISRYSILLLLIALPAMAQQEYRPAMPISKYFYKCASRMGPTILDNNPAVKNDQGYIGLFQFSVRNAYESGLCSKPVPSMRSEQIWRLCDFKGPIAEKYNIRSQYDLRFDNKAKAAQYEMMKWLVAGYDEYIFQKRYDRLFGRFINGVNMNADVLRAILHADGRAALDEFLNGVESQNNQTRGPYSIGACFNQCLNTEGKNWYCD